MSQAEVEIRTGGISVGEEYAALCARAPGCGACVVFTGRVRGEGSIGSLEALELEHYPGMTEQAIAAVIAEARGRWPVDALRVVHRVGRLACGEEIVLVGAASSHRGAAFSAAQFVMDYLKTRAPIWKKEIGASGAHWVESRDSDTEAAARWNVDTDRQESV
jgi:molybdopterin synthase catalytic subunit